MQKETAFLKKPGFDKLSLTLYGLQLHTTMPYS
jgi:hypothetical protein